MKAICVDDEELILQLTVSLCRELREITEVNGFGSAAEALEFLENNTADVALLDIDIPDMNGIELAARIREMQPNVSIIFLTGYSEFAVDAFKIHASGYLLKPISKRRLAAEVSYALSNRVPERYAHISVRTFGDFDLLIDGEPAVFSRAKAKELLAYLVDRQGAGVSRATIFAALWEEGIYDRPMQKQLDVIIRSLRSTLGDYEIDDILDMKNGMLRVRPELLDCDLYRFFSGDVDALNAYHGEYMNAYPWASLTEAYMDRCAAKNDGESI